VVVIPAAFEIDVVRGRGAAGRAWLTRLPGLLADACQRWGLVVEGEPKHGAQGLVWPVAQSERPAVLKITWPDDMTRLEAAALEAWAGRGAVRLYARDVDQGLLLMERLDSAQSLDGLAIGDAVSAAATVLRRLAVPAPGSVPTLADEGRRMTAELPAAWQTLAAPFPRRVLDAAVSSARELGPASQTLLVHRDLHYGNVLAGEREPWLAIDPMPVAGDPEFGAARLLLRRFSDGGRAGLRHRLDMIIDVAGLDSGRTQAWTLVHLVDYWLWALGVGLTEDPKVCDTITDWLLSTGRP
jgi:streptomycin 6-kinase